MEGHSSEHTERGNLPSPEPVPPAEAEGNADPVTLPLDEGSETRRTEEEEEEQAKKADSPAGEAEAPALEPKPEDASAGGEEKESPPAEAETAVEARAAESEAEAPASEPEPPAIPAGTQTEAEAASVRPEAPSSEVESPTTAAEAPSSEVEPPTTAAEAPSAGVESPTTAAEAPSAGVEPPATAAEAPSAEVESPATAAEAPSAEVESPTTAAEAPSAEVESPTTAAEAPSAGVESPTTAAEAPSSEVESPTTAAEAPATEEAGAPAAEVEGPAPSNATLAEKPSAPSPMAEPGFAELLDQSLERTRPIKQGDRLRAVVQRIEDDVSFLDYGGTSEAAIDTRELKDADGSLKFGVGDRIDVTVSAVGDQVKVNRMVKKARDRSVLREAWKSGATVEGKITGTNKGGFDVQISGFRAFCPISQIDRVYCSDPQAFVGQAHSFRIIEYKEGGRRVVVSRRVLIEEGRRAQAEATRASLKVGDELEGKVVRLQPFGAFVDIGGIDGLVHVSELRHARVTNPADVVNVGQTLRVKVIQIEKLGEEKGERISLSAKALEIDPWTSTEERLQVGTTVQGRVLRLMNYGAFVEVLPGVEGLLHVSEVSNQKVRHPREVVKEGETVDVRIIELDPSRKRLSLSMRSPDVERESAPSLDAGMSISGTVSSIKPYGVFVRILEPVSGVDGLLPIEETGLPRGADLSEKFTAGSEVRAEVLRVDDRGRIRLTVRSAEERAHDREKGARSGEGAGGPEGGRRGSRRDARRDQGGTESKEESKEGKPAAQGLGIMANAFKRVLGQR